MAIFVAVWATVAIHFVATPWAGPHLSASYAIRILGPATLVFLIGLFDDLRSVNCYIKLSVQIIAAVLLYANGSGISQLPLIGSHWMHGPLGLILTVGWVVMITNALNLIDGLDGLAAGCALFATSVLFVTSLSTGARFVPLLAIALVGAIAGFLRYNFHPASIFLGDSGSLFIGFVLSAAAMDASAKSPTLIAVALPMLALGLPIMDVAVAIVRRFLNGRPIFAADKEHIHHKLLGLGMSQRHAVLVLYGISAGLAFFSLVLLHDPRSDTLALILLFAGCGLFIGLQRLRYRELAEVVDLLRRAIFQRRIIANNLAVRRLSDSLASCNSLAELCAKLTDVFAPIGFDGFGFKWDTVVAAESIWMTPLVPRPEGDWICAFRDEQPDRTPWKLVFDLVSSRGSRCGKFLLYRAECDAALKFNVNVLDKELLTAIADSLDRAARASVADGIYLPFLQHSTFDPAHATLAETAVEAAPVRPSRRQVQ